MIGRTVKPALCSSAWLIISQSMLASLLKSCGGPEVVSMQVKRRWDEDVVFRNQTRGEPKQQKRFINDTIRNDFHRRFLNRYVR